jgi:hypothetical protein
VYAIGTSTPLESNKSRNRLPITVAILLLGFTAPSASDKQIFSTNRNKLSILGFA